MSWSSVLSTFDSYSRTARIAPASLALLPAIWTAAALLPVNLTGSGAAWLVSAVATCGGVLLLSVVARARGKVAEGKLVQRWGGWPTTVTLRHSDNRIDVHTKRRYHEKLSSLCNGIVLPSVEDERAEPAAADDAYRSVTKRLIELRRGPTYDLIHKENALYGFRRNLWGLKPLGIAITIVCLIWVSFDLIGGYPIGPVNFYEIKDDATARWPLYAAMAANLADIALWLWLIRPDFVRQAGDEYSDALLRTLDAD